MYSSPSHSANIIKESIKAHYIKHYTPTHIRHKHKSIMYINNNIFMSGPFPEDQQQKSKFLGLSLLNTQRKRMKFFHSDDFQAKCFALTLVKCRHSSSRKLFRKAICIMCFTYFQMIYLSSVYE